MILRVGSRDSELAKIQAESVLERIESETEHRVDLTTSESLGDRESDTAIQELGETGVFTGELDRRILDGSLDAAVHSLKDCPTDNDDNLVIGAILPRTTPFDVLLGFEQMKLTQLQDGAVIGTSSQRRRANILHKNPNLKVKECRGNVPTRIEKLEDDETPYDGIVLASAGLERLEIESNGRLMNQDEILPAPGQGAIAVTCRADDESIREVLRQINHTPSEAICKAERAMLNRLEGGCQAPIGAIGRKVGDSIKLRGSVCEVDGKDRLVDEIEGKADAPQDLGVELAETLLERGAEELMPR